MLLLGQVTYVIIVPLSPPQVHDIYRKYLKKLFLIPPGEIPAAGC